MNDALSAEKYRSAGLQMQLHAQIAKSYVNHKNVVHFDPTLKGTAVRELADKIAGCCQGFAAVFSGSDEAGYSYCLVSREVDLRPLGKELTQQLNGRGGGKAECQQGSLKATETEIRSFFET
jgi:alanyl-tRNA synthetase